MTSSQSKDQDTLGLQGELVWEACAATGAGSDPASLLGLPPSSKQEFFQPRRAGLAPSGPPVPPCQHIWLKKLSDGYAVAFVNYTFINATDGAAAAAVAGGASEVRDGSSDGELALTACNASDPAQLWNFSSDGTATAIKISNDTSGPLKSDACWEVNACNYRPGSSVDTRFGCRPVPKPGNNQSCNANMAWQFNKNGTVTSTWSGLCFELEGSGTLAACNGAPRQKWKVVGQPGKQQVVSATNKYSCISNGEPPEPAGKMVFDIASSIGWKSAKVRDLWLHKDLGVFSKLSVSLAAGNGTSKLFKLTKA